MMLLRSLVAQIDGESDCAGPCAPAARKGIDAIKQHMTTNAKIFFVIELAFLKEGPARRRLGESREVIGRDEAIRRFSADGTQFFDMIDVERLDHPFVDAVQPEGVQSLPR